MLWSSSSATKSRGRTPANRLLNTTSSVRRKKAGLASKMRTRVRAFCVSFDFVFKGHRGEIPQRAVALHRVVEGLDMVEDGKRAVAPDVRCEDCSMPVSVLKVLQNDSTAG